jgi:hypothetical protein
LSVTLITLFQFFVDLCLLRRNPQDLPASTALFGVILVVALFAGLLLALTAGAGFGQAFAQSVLDLLLLLGVLHVALKATDKQARYVQTATALLGADALIGVIALVPVSLAMPVEGSEPGANTLLAGLMFIALVVWSVLVVGHILRHAFDLPLAQAVVIAVAFDVLSFVVLSSLVQGGA